MPTTLKERIPTTNVGTRLRDPVAAAPPRTLRDGLASLFFVADFVFLILAGVAAMLAMHLVHQLGWAFIPMCITGMIAAMLVQTLMAFAVAPLLGSIESMVPSMIVAMVSPMTLCVLHLFGCESTWKLAAAIGCGFAIVVFTLIQLYARSCRTALARPSE